MFYGASKEHNWSELQYGPKGQWDQPPIFTCEIQGERRSDCKMTLAGRCCATRLLIAPRSSRVFAGDGRWLVIVVLVHLEATLM